MSAGRPLHDTATPRTDARTPIVVVNGRAAPADAPHLSARDRGFTLADGVFETMRLYDGVAFRLEHHLRRLGAATAVLDIPLHTDVAEWVREAVARAGAAGMRDATVRITVSRGVGAPGVAPPHDCAPTVVIVVSALPTFAPRIYTNGLAVHIASGRRNEHAMTAGLKTLAYADSVAALAEARAAGADDAIFLDTGGHLSDGASSNVFVVLGDALLTPPLSCGALPGITRDAVVELARGMGVPVEARPIEPDALLIADELFLTSSLREIAPVASVNGRPVGRTRPGPLTRRLMDAYGSLVRRETSS